jgi:hypothetical protein
MLKPFLIYVFCPLYILCASMCCGEENEPDYNDYTIRTPDAIFIQDDKKVFAVGDTLWINVQIPNLLKDIEEKELNIYELTSANTTLINLTLFLETEFDQPATINISESEIINVIGTLSPYEYDSRLVSSQAILIDDFYIAKHGILLRQAGQFKIKPLFVDNLVYYFSSEYNDDLVNNINLETSFRSSTNVNEYPFEVLE